MVRRSGLHPCRVDRVAIDGKLTGQIIGAGIPIGHGTVGVDSGQVGARLFRDCLT